MAYYSCSDLIQEYEKIEEEKRLFPSALEVDLETMWKTIELIGRWAKGLTEESDPETGQTIDERIQELEERIEELKIYDQAGFFEGKPTEDQILYRYIACRRINVPQNFAGSIARCIIAPTESYVITILRGEDEIGTITFGAGTKIGVFYSLGAFTIDVGDTLTFKAPEVADNTFETLIFNLKLLWSE